MSLAKDAKEISVGDVLRALEGSLEPVECAGLDPRRRLSKACGQLRDKVCMETDQ